MHKQHAHHTAFTIVELLIVVAIIGALTAVTVVVYNGATARTAYASNLTELRNVQRGLEAYRLDNGRYPDSSTCINNTNEYNYQYRWCGYNQGIDDGFVPGLKGTYMKTVPNLNKSLPDNDTFLYQSRAENGEDNGTAQYQLMRLRGQGLNSAENKDSEYIIKGNGYDGLAWGIKSNPNTPWW